jgi:hypothetical protein
MEKKMRWSSGARMPVQRERLSDISKILSWITNGNEPREPVRLQGLDPTALVSD